MLGSDHTGRLMVDGEWAGELNRRCAVGVFLRCWITLLLSRRFRLLIAATADDVELELDTGMSLLCVREYSPRREESLSPGSVHSYSPFSCDVVSVAFSPSCLLAFFCLFLLVLLLRSSLSKYKYIFDCRWNDGFPSPQVRSFELKSS